MLDEQLRVAWCGENCKQKIEAPNLMTSNTLRGFSMEIDGYDAKTKLEFWEAQCQSQILHDGNPKCLCTEEMDQTSRR